MLKRSEPASPLETVIMLAVFRLHPNGYGITISREIEKRTGNAISLGSVYAALERLTRSGYLSSAQGEPMPIRGGRRKLYYQITDEGRRVLSLSLRALDAMREGIPEGALL